MTFAGQVLRYQDIASDELTRGPVTDFDLHRARHDDHILPTRRIMKIRERRGRSLIDTNTSVSDFGGQRRKGIGIKVLEMRVIIGSCVDADDFHGILLHVVVERLNVSVCRVLRIAKTSVVVKGKAV
jgi:hypothetical protein